MEELRVRDIMIHEVTTLKRVGIVSQRDLHRGALARALGYGEHARRKVLDTQRRGQSILGDARDADLVQGPPTDNDDCSTGRMISSSSAPVYLMYRTLLPLVEGPPGGGQEAAGGRYGAGNPAAVS